jgi:hypothetical protein
MIENFRRRTGRTTGLMLKAIGEAVMHNGETVEFVDHYPHTVQLACLWEKELRSLANKTGLICNVVRKDNHVFITSVFNYNMNVDAELKSIRKNIKKIKSKGTKSILGVLDIQI